MCVEIRDPALPDLNLNKGESSKRLSPLGVVDRSSSVRESHCEHFLFACRFPTLPVGKPLGELHDCNQSKSPGAAAGCPRFGKSGGIANHGIWFQDDGAILWRCFRRGLRLWLRAMCYSGLSQTGCGWSVHYDAEHRRSADVDTLHPMRVECLHL
jgi:hypothetical protein